MLNFTVSYLGVIAAAIVSMILGSIWYGPLFGEKWISLVGISKKNIRKDR